MAETINTQTTGYECVGIEKIEQTYEGLFDNKPNIITIYLTNGDTHQFKVMNGSQGVGIDRIEQRQSSSVSGGRNEFAIILTNGKEYTFSTYNGSGGSGSSGSFNQVLQQLNNMLMPSGKSYLYYNGSGFEWKSPDGSTSGSGSSTSTSVSWENVTNKPSTFTPSSHTHSTSDINGLSSYVKGTKVNNAGAADRLANVVSLWGNNFSGNNSIGTSSSYADLKYVKNIYADTAFNIRVNNNSILSTDASPNIYLGFDYKAVDNAALFLFGNKTKIYTAGNDYHFDFTKNVFDVNSNQIHFGSETNGGKISWDRTNNAFKIEGNVYATGGITALGVSNSATTSNNLDFTFKSVTANTFNVKNIIQISDSLSLNREQKDVYLSNTDTSNEHYIYLDGKDENYYLSSSGSAYINDLTCDSLNISGVSDFAIDNISSTGFNIQFQYGGKTYIFTPSKDSIRIS